MRIRFQSLAIRFSGIFNLILTALDAIFWKRMLDENQTVSKDVTASENLNSAWLSAVGQVAIILFSTYVGLLCPLVRGLILLADFAQGKVPLHEKMGGGWFKALIASAAVLTAFSVLARYRKYRYSTQRPVHVDSTIDPMAAVFFMSACSLIFMVTMCMLFL